jgi:hypothetical protein
VGLKEHRPHIMQSKRIFDPTTGISAKSDLRHKNQRIYDDQILNNRRKSIGSVVLKIAHSAKVN